MSSGPRPSRARRACTIALPALLAACGLTDPPLAWEAPRTVTGVPGDTTPPVRPDGRLARGDTLGVAPGAPAASMSPAATHDVAGHAGGATTGAAARGAAAATDHAAMGHAMPAADVAPAVPVADSPTSANRCGLRRATDARGTPWAAWWRIRPDQSALLEVAQGVAGDTTRWARRWVVDTLDRATAGCDRPAPAIMVDSLNGYVHVAYWSQAVEGPGLFYAHLMDPRASAFEPATALVYGDLPARVALASHGDTLAIAYEDPNSQRGRIALHLSLTAGHLFEQVARIVRVNPGQQPASDPQVALGGGKVWVAWKETSPRGDAFVVRGARIVRR